MATTWTASGPDAPPPGDNACFSNLEFIRFPTGAGGVAHPPGAGAFGRTLGIRTIDVAEGASVECVATDAHVNHNGIVHGGLIMTLLDVAMGAAVVRELKEGERTASVNINTDFLRAAKPGRLVATGRVERRGRSVAFPVGELRDADGTLVARATGVWSITPAKAAA